MYVKRKRAKSARPETEGQHELANSVKSAEELADEKAADEAIERAQKREEWLRAELLVNRQLINRTVAWGVTVLTAVEGFLCNLRINIKDHLLANHQLQPGQMLPFFRWCVGSLFLAMLATIFSILIRHVQNRHREARQQLAKDSYTGIIESPIPQWLRFWLVFVFFLFPLVDLIIYFGFAELVSMHI